MTIAVVIPCFRVKSHIVDVVAGIGPEVERIYVVDDKCPESSGDFVEQNIHDPRVTILRLDSNSGVGGATICGYRQALTDGIDIVVKVDGDGQMDASRIPMLVRPIKLGLADYTKGNRFYRLEFLKTMPLIRLLGNAGLSFLTKTSCGYWNIMDPTNGFTAIHTATLKILELDKIERRYFFETDMLYHLNLARAVVWDVPMPAVYGSEKSNLKISQVFFVFLGKHWVRLIKRLFYTYFLRDFQVGTVMYLVGLLLTIFGCTFGIYHWCLAIKTGQPSTSGTVMLSAFPSLVGIQLLLSFLGYDMSSVPHRPLHPLLSALESPKDPGQNG